MSSAEKRRAYAREYYKTHRDYYLAYQKEWRKLNPECYRYSNRKSYRAHRQKRLDYRKEYYETHRDYYLEYAKSYYRKHKCKGVDADDS